MNGYIGTMTTADTLGMYAVLFILAAIAFGFLAYVYSRIRADNVHPWATAPLRLSDYADLSRPEHTAVDRLKQARVTPSDLDGASGYRTIGYAPPAPSDRYVGRAVAPVSPAPTYGRHRPEHVGTGAWAVVQVRELVGAGAA